MVTKQMNSCVISTEVPFSDSISDTEEDLGDVTFEGCCLACEGSL